MDFTFAAGRPSAAQILSTVVAAFRRYRRPMLLVFAFVLVLSSLYTYRRKRHTSALLSATGIRTFSKSTEPLFPPSPESCSAWPTNGLPDRSMACIGFPKHLLSDILIVIKTGAGEQDKTEAILSTFGACIDYPLIVSDAPDHVFGHDVLNVIADLPQSYAENSTDWPIYMAQLEAVAAGKPVARTQEGWRLDRFKFLPMIDKAYRVAPNAKWYVFIEADIYYFWDTLFRMLGLLHPDEYQYLGTASPGAEGTWFAYGGAGMILSRALMRDLTRNGTQKLGVKYEEMVRKDCCGDAVTAYVIIKELGVRVKTLYPMFSGEEPEWLGVTKAKWCVPLVGLHRVGPEKMARLWKWERCRTPHERPVTFATLLDFTLTPVLEANKTAHWDNAADDNIPEDSLGNQSARACELACTASEDCLQWKYSTENKCRIADRVNAGGPSNNADLLVGWHLEAMRNLGYDLAKNPSEYCQEPTWLVPKIM